VLGQGTTRDLAGGQAAGSAAHGTRRASELDHERDLAHAAAGYRTLRVTWRQLVDTPEQVVAALAAAQPRSRMR
jgi:very-short-patch-repair endonuclease